MSSLRDKFANAHCDGSATCPAADLVGARLLRYDKPGSAEFEIDIDGRHWNPLGTLHGGILCDLTDIAMGYAFASTLDADESFTTLELKINFLRPVREGHLVAVAHVVSRGRTIGLVECDVTDANNKLIARAVSTCTVLRGQQAEGR